MKRNEMGGACGTYAGEVYTVFWWENLSERYNLEDLGVDGMIVLKRDFER
jgi:hypothetical protein